MEVRETTLGDFNREETIATPATEVATEIQAEEQVIPPAPTINEEVVVNNESAPADVVATSTDENEVSFSTSYEDEETVAAIPPAQEQQQPAPISWQDAIKNVDKKEIAKALGISDFALELNEHLSKGGKATDYLNARAIDYTTVPDVDLLKENLRKTLPTATNAQLELYLQKKYSQTDIADDEDKEFGLLQMQADAHNVRQAKILEQQSFKIPEAAPTSNVNQQELDAQQKEAQLKEQQQIQQQRDFFLNHEATKSLMESKRVAINVGEGVAPLRFSLEKPDILTRVILDSDFYTKVTTNAKGEPDVNKLQRMSMVALDDNYEKKIFNAGLMAGKKTLVEENQNIRKPDGGTIVPMNKQGVTYRGETTLGAYNNR